MTTPTAPAAPLPTYRVTLAPDVVAQIVATAMCPKCALRRRRERQRRLAAQEQPTPRPAWDTRCGRGCGAVVLEAAATCEDCTWAEERAEIERVVAAVRAEWAWVLGREARDA